MISIYTFLKNLSVNTKNAPMSAGSNKLITHNTKVAERIPKILEETSENKKTATDPLIPISEMAIVGIIEITKSITIVKIMASRYVISTVNNLSKIKN